MSRTRALCQAVLAIALGLVLSSGSCHVHACSGDCCDHEHCDHREDCDCDHAETHPIAGLPLLMPMPGSPVQALLWLPSPAFGSSG